MQAYILWFKKSTFSEKQIVFLNFIKSNNGILFRFLLIVICIVFIFYSIPVMPKKDIINMLPIIISLFVICIIFPEMFWKNMNKKEDTN